MSWRPREVSIGRSSGVLCAVIGAGCVLTLGPHIGWPVGLAAAEAAGALGSWLAAERLLRDAAACLAAVVADGDEGEEPGRGSDGDRPVTGLGSGAFDRRLSQLREALDRSRRVRAEHEGVLRLARRLRAAMEGPGAGEGTVGTIEPDIEETAGSLRVLLDRLRQAAGPISRDLSGLEEANERVASGAQDQSEAVSLTATSVEALSDRIDRISHHAGEAAEACERARLDAHQALDQVNGVIEGMDRLLTRIEANARKVRRLEERSTEIAAIVELIRGISGRTDILALNATIESIRAGEHGRGFAVIAEEIRKLAERAAAATREIGALVEAIQADTRESIQALAEEQVRMQGESHQLGETGRSLERIRQVAEQSARLVEGISRSTRDQVLATQQLVRAMQRISEVTHQTQERTTRARAFIRALMQSCEPWQRLAAADRGQAAMDDRTGGPSRILDAPPHGTVRADGPASGHPSLVPSRGSVPIGRDAARRGGEGGRSR
jgi:twitching motility protein PilJ